MHLNSEWRKLFPVVYFHSSQVGYTPNVNISNGLNIRKLRNKYSRASLWKADGILLFLFSGHYCIAYRDVAQHELMDSHEVFD